MEATFEHIKGNVFMTFSKFDYYVLCSCIQGKKVGGSCHLQVATHDIY
jgi:hypothetical protein